MSRLHVRRWPSLAMACASRSRVGAAIRRRRPIFPRCGSRSSVTLDGKPIEDGTVQFVPANKAAGPVTQAVILKGRYVASKVPLGKATAIIFAKAPEPPPNITSDYHPGPIAQIPQRYKDGIPIEVKGTRATSIST